MLTNQEANKPNYMKKHPRTRCRSKLMHQQSREDIFNLNNQLINAHNDSSNVCATNQERVRKEMHSPFETVGLMKPSLLYLNPQQDQQQYVNAKKPQKRQAYHRRTKSHRRRKSQFYLKQNEGLADLPTTNRSSALKFQLEQNETSLDVQKSQEPIKQSKQLEELPKRSGNQIKALTYFQTSDEVFFAEENPYTSKSAENEAQQLQAEQANSQKQSVTPQEQIQDILEPSLKMLQLQKQLTQSYIRKQYFASSDSSFVKNAIPEGCRLTFEAFVENSNIFQRQFTFWLKGENEKTLLMAAKKIMKLTENEYTIKQYTQQINEFKFVAKVENKLEFSKYLIWDYNRQEKQIEKITRQNRFFGQIDVYPTLIQGKPIINFYYPSFDKYTNEQEHIEFKQDKSYLQKMIYGRDSQMDGLFFCRLSHTFQKKIMHEHSLVKTKKTIVLKDRQGKVKLYIGKLQSKHYRIIAGAGVSPMLVFALLIVMVES